MKITIESTDEITNVAKMDGSSMPARVWVGATDSGIPLKCFIIRVMVAEDVGEKAMDEIEKELRLCGVPVFLRGKTPTMLID